MRIEFWYDIACPYAYLASTQVEALARDTGVPVDWRPLLLGGVLRAVGSPMNLGASRAVPRQRLELLDLHRQAERLGVPFQHNPRHPQRTVTAMRLLVGCDPAVRPALSHALYRAYWVEGAEMTDDRVGAIARSHGVDPSIAGDPAVKQALFAATDEAVARGAFGVPTFFVGDALIWGCDRLHQVRDACKGAAPAIAWARARSGAPAVPGSSADRASAEAESGCEPAQRGGAERSSRVGAPRARVAARRGPGTRLVFFHDFSSPFTYLASTQIERVAAEAGTTVEWTPFLLGALFRDIGTGNVPLHGMPAAKAAWSLRDLERQAAWWGVPFRYNTHFPLRTVTALRVAIVEPRATAPLYRAAWVDDRDLSRDDVVRDVLDEAGLDGAALVGRAGGDAVKERLRIHTAWAQRIGACGAPTFLVGDDLVFWGQDRLDHVADALAGWRPAVG